MNFSEFLNQVTKTHSENTEWRYGQTCCNVLWDLAPNLYADILESTDPFFDDHDVPEFLQKMRNELS